MRSQRARRIVRHLLSSALALTAGAVHAGAQVTEPVCTLSSDGPRPMMLADGSYAGVIPQEVSARGDSLLILGMGWTRNERGEPIALKGDDSLLVGFLATNGRRVATPIAAPHALPTARYFRLRAADQGWETVFFVPDRDTIQGARTFDAGTLWYGRLNGTRWRGLERVGRVNDAVLLRPNSSGLSERAGTLSFALYYGEVSSPGGVLVWHRSRNDKWRVDSLPLKWGPLSVTTAIRKPEQQDVRFYPTVGIWEGGELYPGSLLSVRASAPLEWKMVRRSPAESMNELVEVELNDTLHVSWWEFSKGGAPSLWYQALDPDRENDPAARRRVAGGVNNFVFLAVPEGAGTRLVWAYPSPSSVDSAEVAVVANGEPMVVGKVAFPFGLITNGVASGDRSFILATTPRPRSGADPSVSRTLEVRVNCRGGS